jgi:ELWxxDGT repeat protein
MIRNYTIRNYTPPIVPEALETRSYMAAQLVADLNPNTLASDPRQFTTLGDRAYFVARSGSGDAFGLYRTDGAAGGTALVADGFRNPAGLSAADGRLYFWATDAAQVRGLWSSDGTAEGTHFLVPGSAGGSRDGIAPEFTAYAGRTYFGMEGQRNAGLWVTDGTPAGTTPFEAATGFYSAWDFAVVGNTLYFVQSTTASGVGGLWKTDGTAEGTVLLREFHNHGPRELFGLTAVNGTLFFVAPEDNSGPDLWKSDGTVEGTVQVKNLTRGSEVRDPAELVNVDGTLFFTAHAIGPRQLWKSDGTAAGTVAVATDAVTPAGVTRVQPLPGGGGVVFAAAAPATSGNWELWRSDGTSEGTRLVKEIRPGNASPFGNINDLEFERVGAALYFAADDGVNGRELWKTDGTAEGTTLVADIQPGFRASNPGGVPTGGSAGRPRPDAMGAVNGRLVFSAAAAADDYEPWGSDGTAAGTGRLADLNTAPRGSDPRNLAEFNGTLLVAGDIGSTERRLFRTDGTPAGTITLTDAAPAPLPFGLPSAGNGFGIVDGVAYYAGERRSSLPGSMDWALYRTDGTAGGTVEVVPFRPRGGGGLPPDPVVAVGGAVYFVADRRPQDLGLWRLDVATGSTTLLIANEQQSGAPRFWWDGNYTRLTPAGDGVYFFSGSYPAISLWRTNGTAAGTIPLLPGETPVVSHPHLTTAAVGDKLFVAPARGGILVSNGTPPGTYAMGDEFAAWEVAAFNGSAYFVVLDAHPTGGSGPALFRTDGTAAGTSLVKLIQPTGTPRAPTALSVVGDRLYFWADDGVHGYEPWVSDGTEAGTRMLADVNPGPDWSKPTWVGVNDRQPAFAGRGGRAYFAADDGTHGTELWGTDGTALGTALEADVYPGPTGSDPGMPVVAGQDVFFAATDPVHGRELWKVTVPTGVAGRYVFYNNSAFDGRDPAANADDDAAIATGKRALLPGQDGTAAHSTGYTRGINGVMIDVAGLPAGAVLTADDFEFRARLRGAPAWSKGPEPRTVSVRRGDGASGSDRLTLVWDDFVAGGGGAGTAVADGWLEITVKANARTGLTTPDVFRFGNLRGDTGGPGTPGIDARDLLGTRAAIGSRGEASDAFDHNRDGRVNVLDLVVVRSSLSNELAPAEWTPMVAAQGTSDGASYRVARRRGAYWIL